MTGVEGREVARMLERGPTTIEPDPPNFSLSISTPASVRCVLGEVIVGLGQKQLLDVFGERALGVGRVQHVQEAREYSHVLVCACASLRYAVDMAHMFGCGETSVFTWAYSLSPAGSLVPIARAYNHQTSLG